MVSPQPARGDARGRSRTRPPGPRRAPRAAPGGQRPSREARAIAARLARATGLAERPRDTPLPRDPLESAKIADLHYVDHSGPGIRRVRRGRGFAYFEHDGTRVTHAPTLQRIASLAVPPAWTDVWICRSPSGHIQATGRDARGRKQYRYHPRFRKIRDETKFERILAFGEALPRIRAKLNEDLSLPGLPRDKVLATVVRLLETTLIRIGNEEYARDNASFGLTTLRSRHVGVEGSTVRFRFRGKSGKMRDVEVHDRRVARVVARCTDLPGQLLFQYVDDGGELSSIESSDVNAYLRAAAGDEFTAKDFRTWAGTVLAARELAALAREGRSSPTALKRRVTKAITKVAAELGNTASVCRKGYVHPEVVEAFLEGQLALEPPAPTARGGKLSLSGDEAAVLALLRRRLSRRRCDDQRRSA